MKWCGKKFRQDDVRALTTVEEPKAKGLSLRARNLKSKQPLKGMDKRRFRPAISNKQRCAQIWLSRFDNNEIILLPSAKLNATIEYVLYWLKKAPGDQIIIFSQFRHFQILLGCMLQKHKVDFLYFSVCCQDAFVKLN